MIDLKEAQKQLEQAKEQLQQKDLEIKRLNDFINTEFRKVYAAFDSLKETHRKISEELDRGPKSTIPKIIMEPIKRMFTERARKIAKNRGSQ